MEKLGGRYKRPNGQTIVVAPTGIEFYQVYVRDTGGGLQPSLRTPITTMSAQGVREMIEREHLTKEESK